MLSCKESLICAAGHPGTGLRGSSLSSGPQLKTGLPPSIAQCLPPDLHHLIYTNTAPPSLGDNYGSQVRVQRDDPTYRQVRHGRARRCQERKSAYYMLERLNKGRRQRSIKASILFEHTNKQQGWYDGPLFERRGL